MRLDLSGALQRTAINAGYVSAIGAAITLLYEFAPWVRADAFERHREDFQVVAEQTLPVAISQKLSEIILFERLIEEATKQGLPVRVREYRIKIEQLHTEIDRIRETQTRVRSGGR